MIDLILNEENDGIAISDSPNLSEDEAAMPYNKKSFTRTADPASEPVTLDEAKDFLRVEHSEEDDLITSLIKTARELIESHASIGLINQTWEMIMDYFPEQRYIEIPKHPMKVTGVTVVYYDGNDTEKTLSATSYLVESQGLIGRIMLKQAHEWPSDVRDISGVKVSFTIGYGSAASPVPERFKTVIKRLVSRWFDDREAERKLDGGDMAELANDVPMRL